MKRKIELIIPLEYWAGDTEWLRRWIGWEIEDKVGEAVEILKMWICAELSGQAMGARI